MRVEPLDTTLGAVVTGVRLADLDDATWGEVEAAFHAHAVLVFPGQGLDRDEQAAFARRFGEIEKVIGDREAFPITNADRDGSARDPSDPVMELVLGNMEWHTDSSYMPLAAKASMLSAHVVPPSGGETEWADMRAAYDALSVDDRALVDGLSAHHSYRWSQARAGFGEHPGAYGYDVDGEPLRPLVKVHPATGRRSLFIGRHAHAIPGMTEEASVELLDRLLDEACRPPRVLTHRWSVGDLVVWDNRCVLHRARPWDYGALRTMVHSRVAGDPATELAASA